MTPDPIFADARLAAVYDSFDGDRSDLDTYAALVEELAATSVLDVGCGTGELAIRLANRGVRVVGTDPAAACLDVARTKPGGELVGWMQAGAADLAATLPAGAVDLAVLTGNAAQVFVSDVEWRAALSSLAAVVRPGGHLLFETRRPERRVWEDWARDRQAPQVREVVGVGRVEQRFLLLQVDLPRISFRFSYRFPDGTEVVSDSTLAFRTQGQITADLAAAGFAEPEVRGAPDRPGLELVFLARRAG